MYGDVMWVPSNMFRASSIFTARRPANGTFPGWSLLRDPIPPSKAAVSSRPLQMNLISRYFYLLSRSWKLHATAGQLAQELQSRSAGSAGTSIEERRMRIQERNRVGAASTAYFFFFPSCCQNRHAKCGWRATLPRQD